LPPEPVVVKFIPGPIDVVKFIPGPVDVVKFIPGPVDVVKFIPGPVDVVKFIPGPDVVEKFIPGPVVVKFILGAGDVKFIPGPDDVEKFIPGPDVVEKFIPDPLDVVVDMLKPGMPGVVARGATAAVKIWPAFMRLFESTISTHIVRVSTTCCLPFGWLSFCRRLLKLTFLNWRLVLSAASAVRPALNASVEAL